MKIINFVGQALLLRVMILRRLCLFFLIYSNIHVCIRTFHICEDAGPESLENTKPANVMRGAGSHVGKIRKIVSLLNALALEVRICRPL
jgi:hypothetical protein